MKSNKLWNAFGNIESRFISEAEQYEFPRYGLSRGWKIAATAACLVLSILASIVFWPQGKSPFGSNVYLKAYALTAAEYPSCPPYPIEENYATEREFLEAYALWSDYRMKVLENNPADYSALMEFTRKTTSVFLDSQANENPIYSPLNLYMALGMLAEATDGSTREQLLSLLGEDTIEQLRNSAKAIWNRNYKNDGAAKTILAGSLWLNEKMNFNQQTLNTISENYYADTFGGDMEDPEYSRAFRYWLNQQTAEMLEEQISGLNFNPQTLLAIATTLYFEAKWSNTFIKEDTQEDIFHTESGVVKCDFMHDTDMSLAYWGDKFLASSRDFDNSGKMTFILPDEGYTPTDLLNDEQVLSLIAGDYENEKYCKINYSVPRFDISSNTDLEKGLKNLGVTEIFNEGADFTPLTSDAAFIGKAEQGARVAIDETGCKASAYTAMILNGAGMPTTEINMVLDKPFLFVIHGYDGAPLFIGVVNNPAK